MEESSSHTCDSNMKPKHLDFASLVVHQLRTPLTAVKWTLRGILNGDLGPLNDEQKKFITKCYHNNDEAIALVNDILSLDRIKSGKFMYTYEKVNLAELIETITSDFIGPAREKDIEMKFLEAGKVFPEVAVDIEKLRSVLQNLLENALTYTPEKGNIYVHLENVEGMIQISVHDTGIGIPESEKASIFAEFYRASNARQLSKGGNGLGLFIVKNIVEGQGGKVWFESKEGKGTTFFFTLPMK